MRLYKGLAIRLGGSIFVVPRCKLARSGHWVSTGYRDISKTSLLHMDDRSSWELYWPIQRGSPPLRHLFRCPSARGVEISSLDNGSSCCSGIRHVCAPVVDGHCYREHREVLGGYYAIQQDTSYDVSIPSVTSSRHLREVASRRGDLRYTC